MERTGDEYWDRDLNMAAEAVYNNRLELDQIRTLEASWFIEMGVKAGLASKLRKRVKEFVRRPGAYSTEARSPSSIESLVAAREQGDPGQRLPPQRDP